MDRFKKAKKEREDFKNKLAKGYDVENNPKLEKCFNLAWEYGHSYGLNEVEYHFDNLVELIK